MKVGKPHLIGSVTLLCGAVGYNAWMFAGQGEAPQPASVPVASVAPIASDTEPAHVTSPAGTLADIALDQPPAWPRDPFHDLRPGVPEVAVAASSPPPAPEPSLVVASILHAADRRLAMINGRVMRVGDVIGTATVVDILPDAVIVDSPGGRRRLPVRPAGHGVTR